MEVGCLRHPGACTIGSQLLDEAGKSWKLSHESPHGRGDRNSSEGGGTLEDVLLCKRILTVNAIAVNAANTSQSRST